MHYTDNITAAHAQINNLSLSPSGGLWGFDFYLRPVFFNTLNYTVTVYPFLDSVNTTNSFTVSSLVVDVHNVFWISMALDGLFSYDQRSSKVVHYSANDAPDSLPTNQLMNIVEDPDDATYFGLVRWEAA